MRRALAVAAVLSLIATAPADAAIYGEGREVSPARPAPLIVHARDGWAIRAVQDRARADWHSRAVPYWCWVQRRAGACMVWIPDPIADLEAGSQWRYVVAVCSRGRIRAWAQGFDPPPRGCREPDAPAFEL